MGEVIRQGVAAAYLLLVVSGPLGAQSASGGVVDVGVSLGKFSDYPTAFARRYCEQGGGAITGAVGRPLTTSFAVEVSATLSGGVGGEQCATPLLVAPRDGETFSRTTYDDRIEGQRFLATHLAVRFEPWADRPIGPRLRVGGGRLWDKALGNWFYGAGVRVRLGSSALTLEVERWALGFDRREEVFIYRDSGAHELQSTTTVSESPKPYLFKVGWERRIG